MSAAAGHVRSFTSPESAIAAIQGHSGPILVDLDETLYLRNSTEDYIDVARPGLLALLMLRALDAIKPWRLTGGEPTRDAWRVRIITIFLPWVSGRWKIRAVELGKLHRNQSLMAALQARPEQPIVVTAGFLPIVRPLVAALGFPDATIVASRG